ncbi:hypothetical protein VTN31DRAFT_7539 [Thermomyces dupontii]|uniref:uncharacterized protein n=1 Tax=Talaromyces thermophilus TaxID=28565 RepID=UPI0037421D5E
MPSNKISIPTTNEEWAGVISTVQDDLGETTTTTHLARPTSVAGHIDHTQLSLSTTESLIDTLCVEALEFGFATVCVRLPWVARCKQNLEGKEPKVGIACVVGFHEGTYSTDEKVEEARKAVDLGATELDMVLNYPLLKEGKYTAVFDDISAVRRATVNNPSRVLLKVILETSQLSHEQIIAGCVISSLAGADYVKTSTGFNGPGATVENVRLMRQVVDLMGDGCKVKASGGVKTAEKCVEMLMAGADRIGTSSGAKIAREVLGKAVEGEGSGEGSY